MKLTATLILLIGFALSNIGQASISQILPSFEYIELNGPITVHVLQSDSDRYALEVVSGSAADLDIDVVDGALYMNRRQRAENREESLIVNLTLSHLKEIVVKAGATVVAEKLQLQALLVESSGSSQVSLLETHARDLVVIARDHSQVSFSGKTDTQSVWLLDTAQYIAGELVSDVTQITAADMSRARIWVLGLLDVAVDQLAQVSYQGSPVIARHVVDSMRLGGQREDRQEGKANNERRDGQRWGDVWNGKGTASIPARQGRTNNAQRLLSVAAVSM